MNRILIAGATGYLGSEAVSFAKSKYEVLSVSSKKSNDTISFNIDDISTFQKVVNDFKPNRFIYFSAYKNDNLILNSDKSEIDKHLEVNFMNYFYMLKIVLPHMIEQKDGGIVYIASSKSHFGEKGTFAYSSSKAAGASLSKTAATEYGRFNINVNNIFLGYFGGPLWEKIPKTIRDDLQKQPLNKRLGEKSEAIEFIFSTIENKYLTKQDLFLDGGIIG